MQWTDERVEKLKKLWAEGLSASQIAAQLTGVSRNAIIGKVHRLSLPGRAKAGMTSRPRSTRVNASVPRTPRAPNYASRTTAPAIQQEEIEVEAIETDTVEEIECVDARSVMPISRRLKVDELTERTCKWPVGDPLKDDFYFCGVDDRSSSPYCSFHGRLAYQPLQERKKRPTRAELREREYA